MPRLHRSALIALLTIALTTLSACGGAPVATAPTAAVAPTTASAPSPTLSDVEAMVATVAAAPAGPTTPPTPKAVDLPDTNPVRPDDTTQGRLRISNCVRGGPSVDLLLNGKLTVNAGILQQDVRALEFSGYLYLVPGTYSVALVPTGEGIDKALLGPLDVEVVAGHRYIVAMLGQNDEPTRTPLVIDETEAYQKAGVAPTDNGIILINNYKGAKSLGWSANGVRNPQVPYGEYAAWRGASGNVKDVQIITTGPDKETIEHIGSGFGPQGTDWFDCFAGTYPGAYDTHTSNETSLLNPVEFMELQSKVAAESNGTLASFTTFLKALETTGMTELLANEGPFVLLAPTDEAFRKLPKEQLDALLADPKVLAELLRGHIVDGYYPYGTFGLPGQGFNRTVTNLRGEQVTITGNDSGVFVNDQALGSVKRSAFLAKGTRFMALDRLLLPDVK